MAKPENQAPYRPDPAIEEVADFLAQPVGSAPFPEGHLRYRDMRAAAEVGLNDVDVGHWIGHFARFEPLPDNLPRPLALAYHGHQFQVYNPQIGDGRGFLFAQMRDGAGRLMDLGTKGSGTTPFSRQGDGRLTLKGAVREILATTMLEAQGVNTSRTFSVVETGEELWRSDEPSPTRSAVLVRLSHGHIRIGSFQRLAALEEPQHLERLVDYCLRHYPGPPPPDDAPGDDEPPARLLHQVVERLADMAASYMVAGFVHGVLNTDNMNITGESFDYGPWRWLPTWDPGFTAAYFDHAGLYAFARQPEAIRWNCAQLALALRTISDAPPLIAAMERYGPAYEAALARRWCWRLGVRERGADKDAAMIAASDALMRETGLPPHGYFAAGGQPPGERGPVEQVLEGYEPARDPLPGDLARQSMLIEEVEAIWDAIAARDDWNPLERKVADLRALQQAMGPAPEPAGHVR
jgi:uncharacterized protein YdiU (UPF0061 family)